MATIPTLPTKLGQIITDVQLHTGVHYSRLIRTGPEHFCLGPNAVNTEWIAAFSYNGARHVIPTHA
ncbi:hypothetical protein ACIA8I_41725 [Streptomyces rishiriensis]|uniref:hypothetical protein n=1 Tax=Streptomyces rishiriensis TaxID=68264 RepID=UPI00379964F5